MRPRSPVVETAHYLGPERTIALIEMSEVRENVRAWLIDLRFGLLGSEELVTLADRAIADIDDPPDYLIAMSLRESINWEPRIDFVLDPIDSDDLIRFAARLLEKLDSGDIDIEKIVKIAKKVDSMRMFKEKDIIVKTSFHEISDSLNIWSRVEARAQASSILFKLTNMPLSD